MKKQRHIILYIITVLFLIQFFCSTPASSKTYFTWVDKNGVTHITEHRDEIPKDRLNTVKRFESNGKYDFIVKYYLYLKSNSNKLAEYFIYLLVIALLLFVANKSIRKIKSGIRDKRIKKNIENYNKSGLSSMSTYQFKLRAAEMLENMGYNLSNPGTEFDGLIDYIGFIKGRKIAIAIHESENLVSRIVVNEIDREKHKHSCEGSMIICRTYFEEDVMDFASQIDCELIDKDKLSKLLNKN